MNGSWIVGSSDIDRANNKTNTIHGAKMEANESKRVPIRETRAVQQLGRFATINLHPSASTMSCFKRRQKGKTILKSAHFRKLTMMIYLSSLTLLSSLFVLGANASIFSFAFSSSNNDKNEQATTTPTTTTATSMAATGMSNHQNLSSSSQSVGDLVAIGAISLLDSPQSQTSSSPSRAAGSITTELAIGDTNGQQQKDKLDYIIDFMRANKLTKFCDLIASQEAPIRQLNKQLNELQQFTLFVPTNEALLLMASGQLEQIKRQPEQLRKFIGAHATDELVVPRLGQVPSNNLLSLSGGQLRVATVSSATSGQNWASAGSGTNGTKLELIVNGANVLSGNSYALQEPNNNKLTYAIVHLIDRVLYPMPSGRLVDKVRQLAPKMSRYFELASSDRQLRQALSPDVGGSNDSWTLFLPGDDAFEATPAKMIEQLDTNRTFMIEFLRGHLIEGLFFSNQLALIANNQQRSPIKLVSFSGKLLEIDTKTVQARTLVLINSTPLLEPDIMALNGVVHLISRPILERHLAEDCNCASYSNQPSRTASLNRQSGSWPPPSPESSSKLLSARPAVVTYEFDNRASGTANWASRKPTKQDSSSIEYAQNSNQIVELEREESRMIAADNVGADQRIRSQRSGSLLVERNNRDFYRPSTAPANLLATEDDPLSRPALAGLSGPEVRRDPFDGVDSYKVVLNATTRQRLRQMQRSENQTSGARFAYDRPMKVGSSTPATDQGYGINSEQGSANFLLRRPYTPAPPASSANIVQPLGSNSTFQDQLTSSSVNRLQQQQLMIKFQPEDARDPAANFDSFERSRSVNQSERTGASFQQQELLTGKTVAPPSGSAKGALNNCAFYDTDCRRVLSKLVRLPPVRNRLTHQNEPAKSTALMQASGSNNTIVRANLPSRSSVPMVDSFPPSLDSTFGETDAGNINHNNGSQHQPFSWPQQNRTPARVSVLNQPLPPWGTDEDLRHHGVNRWPGTSAANQDSSGSDLSRLKGPAYGFTTGISRGSSQTNIQQTSTTKQAKAEILLLPVKIIQEPSIVLSSSKNITSSGEPTDRLIVQPQSQFSTSNKNRQFHTPTPYSVSIMTTHMPSIFANNNNHQQHHHLGRLTNFTAFEYLPEEAPKRASSTSKQVRFETTSTNNRPGQQPLKSPSTFRRQRIQQQSDLESPKQIGRKVVHAQQSPHQQQQVEAQLDEFGSYGGDISITSAKLTNFSGPGNLMATQASNVSANFVRSVPLPAPSASGSDFFQDRTIAEIMDDSGLRIDGQQVTFSRFKECLQDAKLLNLVTQTDNSLSIFMPTDMAFRRLVQQQALLHQQRQREARANPSSSSRQSLLLSSDERPLPLMARASRQMSEVGPSSSQPLLAAGSELSVADQLDSTSGGSIANVGDRLTLDCGSQQVRKLLLDHLSARLVQPKQLTVDTSITSLNGHQLLLSSVPSKKIVVVDGQPVIAATRAKNGMVYVVNKFLNLTQQMPNVLELMESQPNLTTFLSYLNFSSMSDRLKRETGPLTILAPTNEAFEQLTPAARQLINSDPAALADILRGHIVDGAQFGKLIPMRSQLKTMNSDQSIEAKVIKPNVYLLDNQMTSMRLVGTTGNGVVNAIDRLIVPGWLRVSMSSRSGGGSSTTPSSNLISGLIETMDNQPGTRVRSSQSANLNLPTITNQPLRFEQPTNRFSAPSGRDSFLLNSSPPATISDNNLLADFDSTPPSSPTDSPPRTQSPFARLPGDLEASGITRANHSASSSKNMQLIEKLSQLMQTRKFVKYLLRSGVSEKLKPDMNYVILVPTDQAIEKLPKQIIDLLERDRERLADLINYHVLDTTFEYINTIPDGQTLNTLNEKDILFNWHRNNTILTASGAVVMGGIQEENIALLIVDRVLYPTPGDILNIISKSPILSNFTSLVRNAGLEKQLSLAGPFTLFAPSDFAFNQLSKSDMALLRRNKDTARRFLLRHLSQPAVFTSSIALSNSTSPMPLTNRQPQSAGNQLTQHNVPQMMISNSLGEELTLRQRNDYFSVNEVNFSYADVAATNGVVHVIDGLL